MGLKECYCTVIKERVQPYSSPGFCSWTRSSEIRSRIPNLVESLGRMMMNTIYEELPLGGQGSHKTAVFGETEKYCQAPLIGAAICGWTFPAKPYLLGIFGSASCSGKV